MVFLSREHDQLQETSINNFNRLRSNMFASKLVLFVVLFSSIVAFFIYTYHHDIAFTERLGRHEDFDITSPALLRAHRESNVISIKEKHYHGWSPKEYPNPKLNPVSCRVAFLQNNEVHHEGLARNNTPLCDPDGVLDNASLRKISTRMQNVNYHSKDFGEHHNLCQKTKNISTFPVAENIGYNKNDSEDQGEISNEKVHYGSLRSSFRNRSAESNSQQNLEVIKIRSENEALHPPPVQIGVAIVERINLRQLLRGDYYSFEDLNDIIDDAAEYFARYLNYEWDVGDDRCQDKGIASGILIFISVEDRVSYITAGFALKHVLPWWRLEHVVAHMNHLMYHDFGDAIIQTINDIEKYLELGPPTFSEKGIDFIERYGFFALLVLFTFIGATCGEYFEREKRRRFVEERTTLSEAEKILAQSRQKEYRIKSCAICLDDFPLQQNVATDSEQSASSDGERSSSQIELLLLGSDGKPVKLLLCGHTFDMSCWQSWVHSGHGNPSCCPVCRQDVRGGTGGYRQTCDIFRDTLFGTSSIEGTRTSHETNRTRGRPFEEESLHEQPAARGGTERSSLLGGDDNTSSFLF
eukprot:CAMPEP_0194370508 /NCGR_PEP_ID=MMETSP0174-20130528/18810_1 /TAXON_ID=216777 /ORGANISM="Proboscia alata, Strain PI-D3" /LENGTH=581 /DNA_ID=CAMNT_0039148011 /DNA_START=55 /DNA_END=1800 /DNA_ORIENTATION=-